MGSPKVSLPTLMTLLKVDVDEAEGIDEEFNISGLPTFVFLKKGEKVAYLIGNNVEKLRDLVNKHA